MLKVLKTKLESVLLIEPTVFEDARGWLMEAYNKIKLPKVICDFVQDNHSYSAVKGTLRGIHFQRPPMAQAKMVRCIKGSILDFAVDLRPDSETFKQWICVELSAENKKQLFIPRGFGHAFVTLEDNTEIVYKVDNYYSPKHDAAILWSDPELAIIWGVDSPILSDKDRRAPLLREAKL